MSAEIREFVSTCDTCATYSNKLPQESISLHDIPERPLQKVGTDIFTIQNRNYLVTVDYMSTFFEVDFLDNTIASTIIHKLKHHFARHGIPDTVVSDGGPQFKSDSFKNFSKKWSFKHHITSPGNSRANGMAEAAVKVAKMMMRKSSAAREEPYLGLLSIRNTPTEGLDTSPAQRIFGRRTKTLMPTLNNQLETPTVKDNHYKIERKRIQTASKQTKYTSLQPLAIGDNVRMQPLQSFQREWKQATVSQKLPHRNYEVVADDGKTYKRNRQFLRHTKRSREEKMCVSPSHLAPHLSNAEHEPPHSSAGDTDPEVLKPPSNDTREKPTSTLSPAISGPVIDAATEAEKVASSAQTVEKTLAAVPDKTVTRSGRISKKVERLNL